MIISKSILVRMANNISRNHYRQIESQISHLYLYPSLRRHALATCKQHGFSLAWKLSKNLNKGIVTMGVDLP